MPAAYSHTNIVSHDPERLATFYTEVFGCVRSGPDRRLSGEWLDRGIGLPGARIEGLHLLLPGHGDHGPTLEIFRVDGLEAGVPAAVTRPGLMHMAFTVDDVHETLARIVATGGQRLGEVVVADPIEGLGRPDFVYARDPDGNIVELLAWK